MEDSRPRAEDRMGNRRRPLEGDTAGIRPHQGEAEGCSRLLGGDGGGGAFRFSSADISNATYA